MVVMACLAAFMTSHKPGMLPPTKQRCSSNHGAASLKVESSATGTNVQIEGSICRLVQVLKCSSRCNNTEMIDPRRDPMAWTGTRCYVSHSWQPKDPKSRLMGYNVALKCRTNLKSLGSAHEPKCTSS